MVNRILGGSGSMALLVVGIWCSSLGVVACGGDEAAGSGPPVGGAAGAGGAGGGGGAGGTGGSAIPDDPFEALQQVAAQLESGLDGYWIGHGRHGFLAETCDEVVAVFGNCQGSNAASPYGLFFLPRAPGEPEYKTYDEEGYSWAWRLRPDEAVVWLGIAPPDMLYHGLTPYLLSRDVAHIDKPFDPLLAVEGRLNEFASLGNTLNQLAMKSAAPEGSEPFGYATVVIATADVNLDGMLRQRLAELLPTVGLPGDIINSVTIPAKVPLHLGYEEDADLFTVFLRYAVFADPQDKEGFFSDPRALLLRLVPEQAASVQEAETPPVCDRPGGTDEHYLADSLETLRTAVKAKFGENILDQGVQSNHQDLDGFGCIDDAKLCLGDNRDTNYSSSIPYMIDEMDEYVMVAGVNHALVSPFVYSNLTVTNVASFRGVVSRLHTDLEGSVAYYFPNLGLAGVPPEHSEKLYVYKIARTCESDNPYCLELDSSGLSAVALDEYFMVIERAYLNRDTLCGYDSSETLAPYTFRVTP